MSAVICPSLLPLRASSAGAAGFFICRVLHLEPVGLRAARQTSCRTTASQCPLCCITAAVASITASSPLSMERVATHASKKIRGSL
jgi:hypothetical protein